MNLHDIGNKDNKDKNIGISGSKVVVGSRIQYLILVSSRQPISDERHGKLMNKITYIFIRRKVLTREVCGYRV